MRFPSGVTDQYIYFVAVDSTDYVTRETGLSSFTVYRARNGAAAAAYTTPTVAEVSSANMPGVYSLLLDEDMTIGSGNDSEEVVLHITQASMAPVTIKYELYREKITQGETLAVSSGAVTTVATATAVTTVNGLAANVITAASIATGAIDADALAADAITAAKVAADVGTEIGTAVWATTARVLTAGTNIGVLDAAATRAAVGLASANLDTQLSTIDDFLDTEIASIIASIGTVENLGTGATLAKNLRDIGGATFDSTTDTLEAVRNRVVTIDALLDTEIAAILADTNELQTDWADGGRLDLLIDAINAKTTNLPSDPADASVIAGRFDTLDTSVADLPTNAELATALGTADDAVLAQVALVKAKTDLIPAAPAAVGDIPSAATIADAVWDEAIAGHAGAGSTGEQLAAAGSAGDPWSTALPGAYGAGTAGKLIGDNINAPIATVDTVVDAIKAKTDSLTFTVAGHADVNLQYVNDVQVTGTGASGDEWGP